MNKKFKKLVKSFVIACMGAVILPCSAITAFAANAKIAFSDPSAAVDQEFTVSVKITATEGNLGASDVMLSYDPAYIEFVSGNNANGGAGSVRLVGTMTSDTTTVFSYNLKFKALQAGNTTISVSNYEIYDADTNAVEVSKVGTSAVKVKAPSTSSGEAALSSLKVSPGKLSPAFSSGVTEYKASVGADVNKIAVSANAKDGKAKVVVSGDSNLKTGENTVVCKVTAEDGQTSKTYKIIVTKLEAGEELDEQASEEEAVSDTQAPVTGELKAEINGVEYSVASSFDPSVLPEGYSVSMCNYKGNEIACGTSNGINLIYLQDAEQNGGLYIYNSDTEAISPYASIDVAAKSIIVLPIDESIEIPSGFAQTTIKLNGNQEVKGWVWQSDAEQQYCVVYGMNEAGEKGLYRYDIAEKTFQRYFEDPALKTKYDDAEVEKLLNEYNALCKDYNIRFIIIVVLIVLCLILFFMLVNILLKKREHAPKERVQEPAQQPVRRKIVREEEPVKEQARRKERVRAQEPKREEPLAYERVQREDPKRREMDREERARIARERLERERREDDRRAVSAAKPKRPDREPALREKDSDDDFEFIDLD